MGETFVRMRKTNGATQRMEDFRAVSVKGGEYVVSANGRLIYHDTIQFGQIYGVIPRECCGGVLSRVS